jgi:hypothetical protein
MAVIFGKNLKTDVINAQYRAGLVYMIKMIKI